jgi:preprotein translocase subunit SecE
LQVQVLHALPAGEVAEWSIAAVLKTASGESLTGVRIPPSPPEKLFVSNTEIIILAVVIGGVFGLLWWQGQLQRIAVYVQETREELKKCSWPTWEELKGSTLLIAIAIGLLGIFTFVMDQILIFIFIKH